MTDRRRYNAWAYLLRAGVLAFILWGFDVIPGYSPWKIWLLILLLWCLLDFSRKDSWVI
jgi:hypothetical protein